MYKPVASVEMVSFCSRKITRHAAWFKQTGLQKPHMAKCCWFYNNIYLHVRHLSMLSLIYEVIIKFNMNCAVAFECQWYGSSVALFIVGAANNTHHTD